MIRVLSLLGSLVVVIVVPAWLMLTAENRANRRAIDAKRARLRDLIVEVNTRRPMQHENLEARLAGLEAAESEGLEMTDSALDSLIAWCESVLRVRSRR